MIMRTSSILFIIMTGMLFSCQELTNSSEFTLSSDLIHLFILDEFLKVNEKPNLVLADSLSSRTVKVTLKQPFDFENDIEFKISEGFLSLPGERLNSESTNTLNYKTDKREFYIQVHSSVEPNTNVIFSAKSGRFTNLLSFEFITSYPEDIHVSPTYSEVSKEQEAKISISAFKPIGKISNNIPLTVKPEHADSLKITFPSKIVLKNQISEIVVGNVSKKEGQVKIIIDFPLSEDSINSKEVIVNFN